MPFDTNASHRNSGPGDDWKARLTSGDVVRFRFPVAETDAPDVSAKCRPCLVLHCFTRGRHPFVELAYGTSLNTSANRGYEIRVNRPGALACAGLDRRTRFICARRIIVTLHHPFFEADTDTGTPVIGRLEPSLLTRMQSLRARIQAEADMAAEARDAARKQLARLPGELGGLHVWNRPSRGASSTPQ